MPSIKWKDNHKKPCEDCSTLVKYTSTVCVKCSGVRHRKSEEHQKERGRIWKKKKFDEYKKKAFDKLGAFCINCGYNDPRALHIDHVNEDGNKERRLHKFGEGYLKYKRIFEDKNGTYQVLCANCNMIKSYSRIILGNMGETCVRKKHAAPSGSY